MGKIFIHSVILSAGLFILVTIACVLSRYLPGPELLIPLIPLLIVTILWVMFRLARVDKGQRFAMILVTVPLIILGDVLVSLWGEGPQFEGGGTLNINLGYQPDGAKAESLALARLAGTVGQHPEDRMIHIRWVESLPFGWSCDNQDWLDYDRKTEGLCEAGNSPLLNEPSEEWGGVHESLLTGLAKSGFESSFLRDSGCHSFEP